MATPSRNLRHWTQTTIHEARMHSAMDRAAQSGSAFNQDLSSPAGQAAFAEFLIDQINALNEVVVELATQIDTLRGT